MRSWIEASLGHIGDARVAAISIIVAIVLTVALWIADTIPLFIFWTSCSGLAVTSIKASQSVVAFRVTVLVTHFANITVGEYQTVIQRGIAHIVHSQLPGYVVYVKRFIQMLMLQVNLLICDCGFAMRVVKHIHNTIPYCFGAAEAPEMIVVARHFCVIAYRLSTSRRLQGGVQRPQPCTRTIIWYWEAAVLYSQPFACWVFKCIVDYQVNQVFRVLVSMHVPHDLPLRESLSPQTNMLHGASIVIIQGISTHHQHLVF